MIYFYVDEDEVLDFDDYCIVDDEPVRYVSNFITELTGITNKKLENARDQKSVIADFELFLSDNIIVGHNVNFDINFLYDAFEEDISKPLKNDFVEIQQKAPTLWKGVCIYRCFRKDAMQIVAVLGGINSDTITTRTNYIILGNNDYCPLIKGKK